MNDEWTSDYAFEQLAKHTDVIEGAAGKNEATTRMRAIDTIIFDVLGWDKLKVETEKHARATGFVDYCFEISDNGQFIPKTSYTRVPDSSIDSMTKSCSALLQPTPQKNKVKKTKRKNTYRIILSSPALNTLNQDEFQQMNKTPMSLHLLHRPDLWQPHEASDHDCPCR